MTPIFSRSWLVKMSAVLLRLMAPVSLRSAWLMRRACRPTWASPMSPSISARGTSAATESTMTTSTPLRADEGLGDLERLLTGIGLADEQLVDVDADVAGVAGVEGVLGVDEGDHAAGALRVGRDVVAERRLAARLGAVDLGDPAARHAADAERQVERHRAGRDGLDVLGAAVAEAHDRAAAELLLDLEDGGLDRASSLAVPSSLRGRLGLSASHRCIHVFVPLLRLSLVRPGGVSYSSSPGRLGRAPCALA